MSRAKALARLEREFDSALFLVASSWSADRAHDMTADAGRVFLEAARRRQSRGKKFDRATVFVMGRGGHPAFAESVARALRAEYGDYDVIVPTMVNGAFSLIISGAEKIWLHPYAGVGAIDVGPVTQQGHEMDAIVYDDVPAMGGLGAADVEKLAGRLARERHWRRMSRNLAGRIGRDAVDVSLALAVEDLGQELSLEAKDLCTFGFTAETLSGAAAKLVWSLYESLEMELGVRRKPSPRYTETDIAGEVEFEAAVGLEAACIETTRDCFSYVLDSGRPDPDTGVYHGEWDLDAISG